MKNVSKLALVVAAGMMSAGAHAASIEIGEDTTMSLEGEFNAFYLDRDTVDTDAFDGVNVETNEDAEDNADDLTGALEFELSAVRSFDNFDAYVTGIFEFTTLEDGGSSLDSDEAVGGLKGNFGQIELGHTDSVYEDLIHDAVDPFEEATLSDSSIGLDEDTMITYYTPEVNGFSANLQMGYEDEAQEGVGESESALIASAAFDFGAGAIHVGYDDLGTNPDSDDDITGIAAIFNVGQSAELAVNHEMQTIADEDIDFTGAALTVDYGGGNVYGAVKDISVDSGPDKGNEFSQYAVGIDYDIESDWKIWAEIANFDGDDAGDDAPDSLMGFGTEYKF